MYNIHQNDLYRSLSALAITCFQSASKMGQPARIRHGAVINARMRLNSWAAFTGTQGDAVIAGDVAMLEGEVTPF